MIENSRVSELLHKTPFRVESAKSGFFGSTTYKIYYDDSYFGSVNHKGLADKLKTLLNGGYTCGASSGAAYGSSLDTFDPSDFKPGYDAYTLDVYSGNDPDYEFTLTFEDSPIQHFGGISLVALKNSVQALNQAHALGFKHGVEIMRDLKAENQVAPASLSM